MGVEAPPFPSEAKFVMNRLVRVSVIEESTIYNLDKIIQDFINIMFKDKEKDYILRITVILDIPYEIRIFKYKNKILACNNILYEKIKSYKIYDILFDLFEISPIALEKYLEKFGDMYRNMKELSSVDELLNYVRTVLLVIKVISKESKEKKKIIKEESEKHRVEKAEPEELAVRTKVTRDTVRRAILRVVTTSYKNVNDNSTIRDILEEYGIVALGRGDSYFIIEKTSNRRCRYLLLFIKNGMYDGRCARNMDRIAQNILNKKFDSPDIVK